ncbi:TonB-dependent receptor [Porifericola rhodea]|uniref:TonB-dependent receptor n=1 Tax=Porifericola rhodea TaxID=930972 RepID=UPI0026654878|nr:TonB-dependent receptor [Porifericola rhodea]WKN32170.1 TonB-dependent receptor [Porifericola rhodea]
MRRILHIICGLLFVSFQAAAQTGAVKGVILDENTQEVLIGANVMLEGTTTGTVSDIEGNFMLSGIPSGAQTLTITYLGYETISLPVNIKANQTTNVGSVTLGEGAVGLEEIEVIASVAIDRKTPVAVSTIKGREIEQKIGNQEFPEILRSTPSVYVTKQGGGFGDARINVRGFDQRNVAVMINGIPVNDMENGWVYWSNWAGLSDVTSSIQVQRGLSASKLAVSSVGGTINIITNAAEMKKGGAVSVGVGNDGYQKYGLVLSTGLGDNGWAFTLQGTHTQGDGYADGTQFNGWSYFASLAKQFNSQHALNFTVLGAPQWHHQREYGSYDGVTIQTIEERGIKYNPQWGNLDGEEFSWRKNFYHKPKAFLNHYWTISDKTELATSAYVSLGRGGGTGDLGQINGSYRTSSRFRNDQGIVRWEDIRSWNQGGSVADFGDDRLPWSGPGVETFDANYSGPFAGQNVAESYRNGFIRRASMNEHNWYGILSNLTHEINESLTLVAGIDARYYKGLHYRRLEDLLGLDAYYDDDNINNPEHYVTDEGRADGNEIDYYNDGLVNWLGAFAQLEYSVGDLTVFGSGSFSNQGYKRIDYFLYEDSDPAQESDWENFLGGTVKAGANYNINDQHNVFVNGGYFSQQPIFDNVFINYSNEVDEDVENQDVYAIEVGYGFRSAYLSANLNAYSTQWSNRQISRGVSVDGADGTANFSNISQLHQGIELDLTASPVERLNITAMASLGNWRYTDNFNAEIFDNDRQPLGTETLFMEDVKIPDAAQTTLNLGANYEAFEGFRVYASYYYADRIYADFDIATDDSFAEEGNQAWQLPSYSLLDGGLSYQFNVSGLDLTVNLNVNNILDEEYMAESESNVLYDPAREGDMQVGDNGSIFNRVYYGFGRTWNAGLKVRF